MKFWLVLLAVISVLAPVLANDGSGTGVGGSWVPLQGEHPAVRMEREWLRFDAYHGHYAADITFHFRNLTRRALKVPMGFPESGGGVDVGSDFRDHSAYRGFKTWINGKAVAVHRLPAKLTGEMDEYSTYWVKTVWFRPGELKVIRVRYEAPFCSAVGLGNSLPYAFSGGNWRGLVASSDLKADWQPTGGVWTFRHLDGEHQSIHAVQLDSATHQLRSTQIAAMGNDAGQNIPASAWNKAALVTLADEVAIPRQLPPGYANWGFVPLRPVIQALGGQVLFDPAKKRVGFWFGTATKN